MACLSRADIEAMAGDITRQYRDTFVPRHHLCYRVDPQNLAQLLGLTVHFRPLSADGSILGMTASSELGVYLPDGKGGEELQLLDGHTVLIEEALARNPRLLGRLHFTLAHEIGHQLVYRLDPRHYGADCRILHCRHSAPHAPITDWAEWQADSLAAALLMPRDALEEAMFCFGLGEKMTVLSRKYSENRFESFCRMAEYLQVSRSALSYRMEQLGLLDRNCLGKEGMK